MFRGQFEHAIDAKGRTSLPSRFRDVLAQGADARLVITRSPFDDEPPCLHVFSMPSWEQFEAKIGSLAYFDPNVVMLRRRYVSAAVECELDKQGRVLVPNSLRDYAGMTKDVLWAGMGHMVELWAKEKWAQALTMTPVQAADFRKAVAEQLRI
jgi:MraZ protein